MLFKEKKISKVRSSSAPKPLNILFKYLLALEGIPYSRVKFSKQRGEDNLRLPLAPFCGCDFDVPKL